MERGGNRMGGGHIRSKGRFGPNMQDLPNPDPPFPELMPWPSKETYPYPEETSGTSPPPPGDALARLC